MTNSRRIFLAASAALALPRVASAQGAFPDRPVKIVVPFGPGGLADVTFRIVSEKLSDLLGKQVVIENIPGAGGIAAANAVLRAKPDGHTMLVIANGTAITKSLFKSLPFDIQKDFVPVSLAAYAGTPDELRSRLNADIAKWAAVIKQAGLPQQ